MGAVPLSPRSIPQGQMGMRDQSRPEPDWLRIGASCALLTGSLLLLAGKRRAGLLVTATGTALAMVEEKELVKEWWNALPNYLNTAQRMLDQAQETIDDVAAKRDRVMAILGKQPTGPKAL